MKYFLIGILRTYTFLVTIYVTIVLTIVQICATDGMKSQRENYGGKEFLLDVEVRSVDHIEYAMST